MVAETALGSPGTFPELTLLVAMTREGVIGRQGGLPWHLPEELGLFRRLTWGHAVVMGRRTFESIGGPLPGRRNLVISRTLEQQEKVVLCRSFAEALERVSTERDEVFFIGGKEIYRQALPLMDSLAVSWIREGHPGEVRFPDIDWCRWKPVSRREYPGFVHVRYRRRQGLGPTPGENLLG